VRVEVRLRGRPVGTLAHHSALGDATLFQLDEAYRGDPEREVLGQVFEDQPGRAWRTTHLVPPWFSNLLPDRDGALRRILAEQARVNPERELHLLAALGADLPGAVTMHALGPDGQVRDDDGAAGAPLERPRVHASEPLRFSLAGLQLKFSVDRAARGATLPVRGQGGRWIAKLPDPRFEAVPVNEAAVLSWARAAGIDVPDHVLIPVGEIAGIPASLGIDPHAEALLVRRFDRRDDGASVHIEDLAQVRDVYAHDKYTAASYEAIGRVLLATCGPTALRAYVARLCFMVVSGNADLHLKNWSLRYADGRRATLAPAYDLVSTVVYPGTSRALALNLAGSKRFEDIGAGAFRRFALKVGADPDEVLSWAGEAWRAADQAWPAAAPALPRAHGEALRAHRARLRW
jgi:serine/threonine-protein kinase HipA